ncbi:DUF362 domain-containing protein [uncultured Desulfuromusa sp.]|uniref:DUF362 domain-containing protein n=1 Tax=uncultured Desulfuromusa sp. TaxID=219183 RepID=UPI002AA666C8|nr:DUF362 domain-containing protein [uncultured Desulfuromusa sp.]
MTQSPKNDAQVSLKRLNSYDPEDALAAIEELLDPLGGMSAFVKPGDKVLLKPNLLAGKTPDKAVTTHPEIVRAVIKLAQKAGGEVFLGDSPGIGSPENVARKSGILAVVKESGCHFTPFETSVTIHPTGGTFNQFEVAREVLDADVIINLPKLKTHQMMGLTCGIKNMFGAVVGLRKPRLHLQAGTDKAFFALMLLELCEAMAPALTIVDAVVGMEGEGPGSGDPIKIGALLAGSHPQAVDTVATELVGLQSHQVWTQQQAINSGRPYTRIEQLQLSGDPLQELKINNFHPAKMTDVNFGLKGGLKSFLKHA